MTPDAKIIKKVTARAADPQRRVDLEIESAEDPPCPLSDPTFLKKTEARLGFRLPRLLKRLYLEVGDGGFGPGAGLFGARSGHWVFPKPITLAELYKVNHKGAWPDKLVPICDWGCGIYSCIDCSRQSYPMVVSDPNWVNPETNRDQHGFLPENIGFRDWIEAWADGVDLWRRFEQQGRSG